MAVASTEKVSSHTSLETSVSTKVDMVDGFPGLISRVSSFIRHDMVVRINPRRRNRNARGQPVPAARCYGVRWLAIA